jgi:signal transduction histidine kinase
VKSAIHDPDGVLVSVEDAGTGIDPKDIDRIFESFFTTKAEGMGMGLSICRSIIEAHDGRLWATANVGRGAVFNILLPTSGGES